MVRRALVIHHPLVRRSFPSSGVVGRYLGDNISGPQGDISPLVHWGGFGLGKRGLYLSRRRSPFYLVLSTAHQRWARRAAAMADAVAALGTL